MPDGGFHGHAVRPSGGLAAPPPCDKTENSSIPSALVLVLLLPATVHYYVVVVSVAVAILLGKHAFGGYGHYPFNPAAFGYAALPSAGRARCFCIPCRSPR